MKATTAQYPNEFVSLTILALMIVALAAGQLSSASDATVTAGFEQPPEGREVHIEVVGGAMFEDSTLFPKGSARTASADPERPAVVR